MPPFFRRRRILRRLAAVGCRVGLPRSGQKSLLCRMALAAILCASIKAVPILHQILAPHDR